MPTISTLWWVVMVLGSMIATLVFVMVLAVLASRYNQSLRIDLAGGGVAFRHRAMNLIRWGCVKKQASSRQNALPEGTLWKSVPSSFLGSWPLDLPSSES